MISEMRKIPFGEKDKKLILFPSPYNIKKGATINLFHENLSTIFPLPNDYLQINFDHPNLLNKLINSKEEEEEKTLKSIIEEITNQFNKKDSGRTVKSPERTEGNIIFGFITKDGAENTPAFFCSIPIVYNLDLNGTTIPFHLRIEIDIVLEIGEESLEYYDEDDKDYYDLNFEKSRIQLANEFEEQIDDVNITSVTFTYQENVEDSIPASNTSGMKRIIARINQLLSLKFKIKDQEGIKRDINLKEILEQNLFTPKVNATLSALFVPKSDIPLQ